MDEDDVSVRVAVRVRPQIPREVIDMCQVCTEVTPNEPQVTLGSDRAFTYDYVFDIHENQEDIYNTCVASLVESSLEGYNATILAYGQTGSGKTYTMGSGFDVELPRNQIGIIPRAIEHLFDGIQARIQVAKESGMLVPEFKVLAQFMELYNEEVIDLFNPAFNKENSYTIHEDSAEGINIKGISLKTVVSSEEALQCLKVGALSRTTASTQMNTQSSRSHAIFTLHIKQQRLVKSDDGNESEFETLSAKFHFVDLAGSERLKRSGATGDRAKEGIFINRGLFELGNVISALGDQSQKAIHIPYRNSKLTRLLQDSLGGNSKTVMIACVSPSDRDFMETLNTLKYANRAKNIKNKVFINQDKSSRTITQLRQQIAQLQFEITEYKQGKRIIDKDGSEMVNDMFYENTMLQNELNNLRTRVKAMQDTIDALTTKNTNLLSEKASGKWISTNGDDNQVADMVHTYLKEIEDLRAKLMESNYTCETLRKQMSKCQNVPGRCTSQANMIDISLGQGPIILEEAKKALEREKMLLQKNKRHSELDLDISDNSEGERDSECEDQDGNSNLNDQLMILTTDIDMKQKLIDELELSQRRIQTMKQHYEDKLMQLQARIRNTQEERDQVLQSYSGRPLKDDKVKKVKDEYTRKLTDMQKELNRLQSAQKEHTRLLRTQNNKENQLQSFKNELAQMKNTKVKLMKQMKEESQRHKESEMRKKREIAQLLKESRKNENTIKNMEAERRLKDKVLKRKQEEVSLLRKNQMGRFNPKIAGKATEKIYSKKIANQKWLKLEKCIHNIAMSKRGIVEQEVRMEYFLEKRENLGRELEILLERRKQAVQKFQDTVQLDSLIEDIEENINYVQETITETQHNVMEIEETQDTGDSNGIQEILDSMFEINESKYLIQKLFGLILSQNHTVAQMDAKLKESDATISELRQENSVKGQLLDHILHTEHPVFARELITSVSSNTNDMSSNSSRSGSPVEQLNAHETFQSSKSKIRQRTAAPADLLFGADSNMLHSGSETCISRIPSIPESLKLNS